MTNDAYNPTFYLIGLLIFFRLNVDILNVFGAWGSVVVKALRY